MRLRSWLVIAALAVSGCASGPGFRKVDDIPQGKALIYIYRPAVHGAAIVPGVVINKLNSIPLQAKGYYVYLADPGQIAIAIVATGRKEMAMDVKAGETYYVRGGTIIMAMGIPYIEQVSAEVALPQIADCKRLPPVEGVSTPPMP